MCGITGVWYRDERSDTERAINIMNGTIVHRGPDSGGIWCSTENPGLAFGHRRLSVLDLSPEGAQPKISPTGRYVITFNGEIYNFLELREDLISRGALFRGRSDTEVLLAGFEVWGIKETLTRTVGMFAMGVWDRQSRILTLARDRIGEKPLYYASTPSGFIFGSELRALRNCPDFHFTISNESVGWYFKYGYIPAPLCIFKEARKLLPGTLIEIKNSGRLITEPLPYWSLKEKFKIGSEQPFEGSFEDAVTLLDKLLNDAILKQMISDVPLGAFLSGGVDSSTVVAIMQKNSSKPIKTFSIGFEEPTYDEAPHAAKVAKHLGTDHTELYVSGEEALAVVPKLASIFDEPFSDSSQIPTYLVAKLAKSKVTVALSGDGGDEAFAGYTRYQASSQIFRYLKYLPKPIIRNFGSLILKHSNFLSRFTGQRDSRWSKLGSVLQSNNWNEIYDRSITIWSTPEFLKMTKESSLQELRGLIDTISALWKIEPIKAAQLLDFHTYLPDDILVKVDRATMAVSLESRAPFLDHRIIEFASTLPKEFKSVGFDGKRVLKSLLFQYVPKDLVDRPKMGFGIPMDTWLRGPLKDWVNDLLTASTAKEILGDNWQMIFNEWEKYLNNQLSNRYGIWSAAILCDWAESLSHQEF